LALSVNWFSGVSGTARTKTALLIEIVAIFLYLFYVALMTFRFEASLPVIWTSEYVYISTLGILSYLYLKFGNWHNKEI